MKTPTDKGNCGDVGPISEDTNRGLLDYFKQLKSFHFYQNKEGRGHVFTPTYSEFWPYTKHCSYNVLLRKKMQCVLINALKAVRSLSQRLMFPVASQTAQK